MSDTLPDGDYWSVGQAGVDAHGERFVGGVLLRSVAVAQAARWGQTAAYNVTPLGKLRRQIMESNR